MPALPELYKIAKVTTVQHANTLTTTDYISTKNANKVYFLIAHDGAADDDMTFSFVEATEAAGTTTAAVTATSRIWTDIDAGTSSDTLAQVTAAASNLVDTTTMVTALVIMEWDPRQHTAGYNWISLITDAGHANNWVFACVFIEERYRADQPPTVIA
jgi:hypothetical protein